MYGIPVVAKESFLSDLDLFLKAGLPHLSLYSLTLEKGTKYSRDVTDHKKLEPEENLQSEILTQLPNLLKEQGYLWYEVSNYAKPGFESLHNLKYWTYEPYLGIGPGAHGMIAGHRYGNPRNAALYQKKKHPLSMKKSILLQNLALPYFGSFLLFDIWILSKRIWIQNQNPNT